MEGYDVKHIKAFVYFFDSFIVLTQTGELQRLHPDDPENFYQWLEANKVPAGNTYFKDIISTRNTLGYLFQPPLS